MPLKLKLDMLSPLMTNPPVPLAIADSSIVVLSFLPNLTSAIASGTGGFVINGENVDDISGNSVSTAGDINGDGLNDLIVGARGRSTTGEFRAGKLYVIFGKKDNTTIDLSAIAS
jgi:high-affinity K+ transport system ATPase subunit B